MNLFLTQNQPLEALLLFACGAAAGGLFELLGLLRKGRHSIVCAALDLVYCLVVFALFAGTAFVACALELRWYVFVLPALGFATVRLLKRR